jgi:hypothetical protein
MYVLADSLIFSCGTITYEHMPSHNAMYVNENANSCENENTLRVLVTL